MTRKITKTGHTQKGRAKFLTWMNINLKKTVNQDKVFRCARCETLQIWRKKEKSPPKWYGHEWRNGYDTGLPSSTECVPAFWRQKTFHTFEAYPCLELIRVKYNIKSYQEWGRNGMIFIYRIWVCNRWQRSVKLYKNRKETTIYAKGETIHKTIKNTEYTK
jgi:hypothetical protein